MKRIRNVPYYLPRPDPMCTFANTPWWSWKHEFVTMYDRPWQNFWRKRILKVCRNCAEAREVR